MCPTCSSYVCESLTTARRGDLVQEPEVRFLDHNAIAWRAMAWISRPFATESLVSRDVRSRTREQFLADLVNDGLGLEATVEGRDHATNILAVAVPIAVTASSIPLFAVAVMLRHAAGLAAAGAFLMVVCAVLFPVLGLALPLSWRFWLARRQLSAWKSRDRPEGERPDNRSLPRAQDALVGLLIGGALGLLMILELSGG